GVCACQRRERSGVLRTRPSSSASLRVSVARIAATAPPSTAARSTRSTTARVTSGRAPSWISTSSGPAGTASTPCRTESARCAPPGTTSTGSSRSHRGALATSSGGRTTTVAATSGCSRKGRSAQSRIGSPRSSRYCLRTPPEAAPMRLPEPPATITAAAGGALREEALDEVPDIHGLHDLQPPRGAGRARLGRHVGGGEAHPRRLPEAPLDLSHRPQLPPEPQLADDHRVGGDRAVEDAGGERRGHRRVARGLHDPDPPHHVEEDVELPEGDPRALLQHREEEGEALVVEAGRHPLRRAVGRLRRQRLHLHE